MFNYTYLVIRPITSNFKSNYRKRIIYSSAMSEVTHVTKIVNRLSLSELYLNSAFYSTVAFQRIL